MVGQLLTRSNRAGSGTTTARIVACVAVISSLALLAPRAATAQHSAAAALIDNGTVTMVTDGSPADLDPASEELVTSLNIAINIDEALVALDGAHMDRYKPMLATAWSSNADKSVWTFHLRHGVRFHTGRCCMTAEDVKYNYVRVMKAGLTNAYIMSRFMSNPDKQIQIVDPYTIRFNLGRPQPVFLGATALYYAQPVLDSHALKAHATRSDPWAHNWATDHDAGTGPYRIRAWTHAQQVTLARFPGYWGGWSGPHFSTVAVRTVPEASTRRELMERGQADLTHDLTPQDYQALSKTPNVRVIAPYGTEVQYVVMTEAGPLASPYARQAVSYAFNYDAYLTAAYHGYARRAYGPLARTVVGYDPHIFHYQTDLARARVLLRKAGVKPGTTLTYMYTPGLPWARLAGLILQAQLTSLGITVKLEQVDLAAYNTIFFGREPAGKRPNLLPFDWWPDYDDPYDQCVPLVASYSAGAAGANAGYYHNKEVDVLLAQMKNAGRKLLIGDAQKLQDITGRVDPPAIWIAEPAQVTILARSLKGYVFSPLRLYTYYFYTMHR